MPGIFLVVLGELSVRISPAWFPWLAPFGLTYGLGWFALAVGVLWRVISFRWVSAAFPLVVLAATFPSFMLVFSTGWNSMEDSREDSSKWGVMTFNVRRLDEFGWLEGENTRKAMAEWLTGRTEEVWCLQEFPNNGKQMLRNAGFSWSAPNRRVLTWPNGSGPALVTSLPIVDWETWMFSEVAGKGRVLQADLETPTGVVRIFNVHLQSLYFSQADYDAVEEGPSRQEGIRLLGLMMKASGARAMQSEELRQRMEASPYPVVVAGDFNDTPMSYSMRQLRKSRASDAFGSASAGLGGTHIGTIPGLRIDGILADTTLTVLSQQTHDVVMSDHRPVSAVLGSGVDLD